VQQAIRDNLTVELNGTVSRGRRLLTSDVVNRQFTLTSTFDGRPNTSLPDVEWRSSQGKSLFGIDSSRPLSRAHTHAAGSLYLEPLD